MKKLLSALVSLSLVLSLSAVCLAAPAAFGGTVTVNGVKLDLSMAPFSTLTGVLPMRAVVEADYGFADYYPDEDKSYFSMDGIRIYVTLSTGQVERNGEVLPGVKAQLSNGTTFLPASVLEGIPGYTVSVKDSDVTLTTPNSEPLVKLARSIMDATDMGMGNKAAAEEMEEFYGIKKSTFESVVGFFPMMINADTVVIGKVAAGQMEEAKQQLEARKAATIQSFEQYLPGPLELAKNGQIVTSGDYIMLIISPDTTKAIELFQAGVK